MMEDLSSKTNKEIYAIAKQRGITITNKVFARKEDLIRLVDKQTSPEERAKIIEKMREKCRAYRRPAQSRKPVTAKAVQPTPIVEKQQESIGVHYCPYCGHDLQKVAQALALIARMER